MKSNSYDEKLANKSWKKRSEEIKESEEILTENENPVERDEKNRKRTLFNDLRRFKKHNVSIFTFDGEIVQGKLIGYDEVANCIIEGENSKKTIVFGKVISLVCEGELHFC